MPNLPRPASPAASSKLAHALADRDVPAIRQALACGASVYERLETTEAAPWEGALSGALHDLPGSGPGQPPDIAHLELLTPVVQAIAAAAEPGRPLPDRNWFVFRSLMLGGVEGVEWALSFGLEGIDIPRMRESTMGISHSLFDMALRNGQYEDALVLWDTYGVLPKPAGPNIFTHASPLKLAVSRSPCHEGIWNRLLEMQWPQEDLDQALSAALATSNVVGCKRLLEKGASPMRSHLLYGEGTASELASTISRVGAPVPKGVASLLLEYGARVDDEVQFDVGANHSISHLQSYPEGKDIPPVLHHGVQMLGLAAAAKKQEPAKELIAAGANINHQSLEGNTPLHLAGPQFHMDDQPFSLEMVAILLQAGAKAGIENNMGHTPLEAWALALPEEPVNEHHPSATFATVRDWVSATLDQAPQSAMRALKTLEQKPNHPLAQCALSVGHARQMEADMPRAPSRPAPRIGGRF